MDNNNIYNCFITKERINTSQMDYFFGILKILILVDVATPVLTGDNNKCGLILQHCHSAWAQCQKYNRGATAESVYSAAKQNHVVLIKKSVKDNSRNIRLHAFFIILIKRGNGRFPTNNKKEVM